jgi:hypothetical protein
LVEDSRASISDSVEINYGSKNSGTSWHYTGTTDGNGNTTFSWVKSQQRTTINQAPLFELYDVSYVPYGNRPPGSSSFTGSKIFGYEIGNGKNDTVLGFPLKYKNSIGVGSYLFRNYFMTESISVIDNNISTSVSTSIAYFKIDTEFKNVWVTTENYKTPIIETQTVTSSTSTVTIRSVTTYATAVTTFVNGSLTPSTLDSNGVTVHFESQLNENDVISFEIVSNGVPNSKGFYKTPLSLTNNPLNGSIGLMTLSELEDHLLTMVNRDPNFKGNFPGSSNLRDLDNYTKYGSRLIINANPISYTQIFLGKKEHNVVDAIRNASDQYNQFNMNLLRLIAEVDAALSPADALDLVLKEINLNKSLHQPYYNSDMLGYGADKKTLTNVVSRSGTNYIVHINSLLDNKFDLSTLSFKSVLVYVNNVQLVHGKDYIFHPTDETIEILKSINKNDVLSVNYYSDTHGSFIPSTPSKLGLYPKYEPIIYEDASYIGYPVNVIMGHDGSTMRAYNDYRDNIILEYEKRVYNNIKVTYNTNIFDVNLSMPGAFRNLTNPTYSLNDALDILTTDFTKWVNVYNIDATTNNLYDEGDPFTWNYIGSKDKLLNSNVSGYWRGLYKYYFDTDRPHTHPWEMLGYTSKPNWWDIHYNWIDPLNRTALINAITHGNTLPPPSTYTDINFARPNFSAINPVDLYGNLKDPSTCLVTDNSFYDKKAQWKFGDQSPAETAWRKSSFWPFAINALSALLYPCAYTSSMFDTSRTKLNGAKQLTYSNNIYLDPRKLLLDGDVQTSGYGVYVIEKGQQENLNYTTSLKQDLTYLDFNLFHKLGGFATKDKLQIVIDSIDPVSQAQGAILPPEDYSLILNVSNPIKSASISGVIIQKLNGKFIIKGYDKINPYFEVFKPIKNSASHSITVGGVSSPFTDWTGIVNDGNSGLSAIDITSATPNTTLYFKPGQIVRYNGTFYLVKVAHASQSTFDIRLFQKLVELPMTGGATVQTYSKFENSITQIYYGTSFSTIQEVYDVLIGYGKYLESQGFIFDEYNNDLNDILDWKFTGREFLYWTTQNWADGNLITLSPFAEYLKYSYIDSIVDDVSAGKYEYSLLKADGKSFPKDKFQLSREDGVCTINTIDTFEGIFFATLNSVQKEHAMVFNNTTVFNDTIYDKETGYKQRRIKLSGFRTANWNGDITSPGFVYDNVNITDWSPYSTYIPGDTVRYNGGYYEADAKILNDAKFDFNKWIKLNSKPVSNLLPNFDYKINQFEDFYSLDIDNFDSNQQRLAQHLIGYTPRVYFNNIFTNPITQYKFYQGFIREKGTKNAIDKLNKVGKFTRQGNISFNEDWAFRVGEYGSYSTYKEIEFTLNESSILENSYLVKLVDDVPTTHNPLINYVVGSELLITPTDYKTSGTFITLPSTFFDNNLTLVNAGYARLDDVTATAYNKTSLLDIANNSVISEGDTIWMGFLENGDWGISRYTKQDAAILGVYVSSPAIDITFTTNKPHNLAVGDIISIVRFNAQVNGIHIVTAIPRMDQFTVSSALTTIVNSNLLSYGELFRFETARFSDARAVSELKNLLSFKEESKLWIDNAVGDKWQVYKKIKNYLSTNSTYYSTIIRQINQHLGSSIYTSDNTDILMASAPGNIINNSIGSVAVYLKNKSTKKFNKKFEYPLNTDNKVYSLPNLYTDFGHSMTYDKNKKLFIVGVPGASNVVVDYKNTNTTGVLILSTGSGYRKPFLSEGVVKISSHDTLLTKEMTELVLVNPWSTIKIDATRARFGHSIYINQVNNIKPTTLLVSAPGAETGYVYAYQLTRPTYYKSTAAEVIRAYAINLLAEVHPSQESIIYWMKQGLGEGDRDFNQAVLAMRELDPNLARSIDTARAEDQVDIIETRADVINAFQNNILAPIYPSEKNIRFWMLNGLGPDNVTFNNALLRARMNNAVAAFIDKQRADALKIINRKTNIKANPAGIEIKSYVALNKNSNFGHKIAGNESGSMIAISAPYYLTATHLGIVQLYSTTAASIEVRPGSVTWEVFRDDPSSMIIDMDDAARGSGNYKCFQLLSNPFNDTAPFGDDVAVSNDGEYIFVSSTNSKKNYEPYGKVAVYKLALVNNVKKYELHQIISNPSHNRELKFGYSISISQDNNTLAISSLGTNSTEILKFDEYSKVGETTFDGGTTHFTKPIPDSGAAYVYNNIDGYFILSEELYDDSILEGSKFGSCLVSTNESIFVGAPLATPPAEYNNYISQISAGPAAVSWRSTTTNASVIIQTDTTLRTSYVYNGLSIGVAPGETGWGVTSGVSNSSNILYADNTMRFSNIPFFTGIDGKDESRVYQFIGTGLGGWKVLRQQDDVVDVSTVDRIALIDSFKEEVVEYLDVVDPLKGKIAGIAEQELKYKSAFDPAIYTIGVAPTIVDPNTSWIDDHVGELWWDLSTVKYTWYEQGDDLFRKNNWGRLFPGSRIDVYEWVKSSLMPSEWAAQADTNLGLTKGISGQPKYANNSNVSVKQLFNSVTNSFENVYFFWVKNKVTVPSAVNRRINSYQVASIIADPISNGLKFAEILSSNSISFANISSMLVGNRINANIAMDAINNEIPKHTEWALLSEDNPNGSPPVSIEKKLFDSLLGHDLDGNTVPELGLTYRNKYGTSIRPRQSLFKDRIQALRNCVEFINSVLINNRITGNYSFENLNKIDPIPNILLGEYDLLVESLVDLNNISTIGFTQAILECQVANGKIISVDIISPGYGYVVPPYITINSTVISDANISTTLDSNGSVISVTINNAGEGYEVAPQLIVRPQTVIVKTNSDYNGRWTKHQFNYNNTVSKWTRIKNQIYNTSIFWKYIDWISDSYVSFKEYSYVLNGLYELDSLYNIIPGEYVKINNVVEGNYIILERLPDNEVGNFTKHYNIVFSQNGTIQILDTLWNYSKLKYSYDVPTLDEVLYDQMPDMEINYILAAMKYDIFINDLKVNWNKLFFTAVKYALTEQKLLDWAFKTSFINVTNSIGNLDQRPVYKLDNEQYFEDYINEVKPYHSKIRTYTSNYTYLEDASLDTTDFDLPSYFNTVTNKFDSITIRNTSTINQQPWRSWANNYSSEIGEIVVAFGGNYYTEIPSVTITGGGMNVTSTATAVAYLSNGEIYKIIVTDPGAGYTETPEVTITGGGPFVISHARASAKLLNLKTRKNTIGIKFDRINAAPEIDIARVTDSFICSGDTNKFVLTWLAEHDKIDINATLDKKLILSSDYTIEYYTEEYNGYNKKYSRFVFLNYVPLSGQVFRITYNKNIDLYTAVDRIKYLYTSTAALSSLMGGIVYPGNIVQGLPFDYSVPWDTVSGNGTYDAANSTWSELVNYYTTAKLASTAIFGTNVLHLNTTTGIVPGQIINVLNSPIRKIRNGTIVTSVNSYTNNITISRPAYKIFTITASSLNTGSSAIVKTRYEFNGGIVSGDRIFISNVNEYNGTYIVESVINSDQFTISLVDSVSTTTPAISTSSGAILVTVLSNIDSGSVLLDRLEGRYDGTGIIVINLYTKYNDIINSNVFLDNSINRLGQGDPNGTHPVSGEYYNITKDINGNALVTLYEMNNLEYDISISVYGNPVIEFWKDDTLPSELDTSRFGGYWNRAGLLIGARGSSSTDIILDGDAFLNPRSGHAPEELVAGNSLDSVGINVYTKADNSNATVISGTFPVIAGEVTTATLSIPPLESNLMIHYNGLSFDRLSGYDRNSGPYFKPEIISSGDDLGNLTSYTFGADDTFTGPFELNMTWNMYGTDYTQVYVGTNGYLTFGGGASFWTPLSISALNFPAIFVEYCDLWQSTGINQQPLDTGEVPGLYISTGVIQEFVYWRLKFRGSHYTHRNDLGQMPAYNYDVTLYSNGSDQYIEMIYQRTWKGNNFNGDTGFVTGVASPFGRNNVGLPYTRIADNSSHVFYSTVAGGNWKYAGAGKFEPNRNPFVFTTSTEYYTIGNTLYLAPQSVSGRASYTMINVGSDNSLIDKNIIVVDTTSTAIVESLASINDVQKACVFIDGVEATQIFSTGDYGYILTYVGEDNKRACIKVYNLSSTVHTIEAWFFRSIYANFNRIHEETFTVSTSTSTFLLSSIPGNIEPVSEQVIVEAGTSNSPFRRRLTPPKTSYYKVIDNQLTYNVDNSATYPQYTFNLDKVKVYANGVVLRPGFDYTLDEIYSTVTINSGLLRNGDALAIMALYNQQFVISGNILKLSNTLTNTTVKVTSFTDHDNMLIRTERFVGNPENKFKLSFPYLNDNYVWVYLNGAPLISKYEYEMLDDSRTIKLNDNIISANTSTAIILITTVNPPSYGTQVVGYRVFNDMFKQRHFKRLSSFYSTTLERPLHFDDNEIYLTDASKLIPPNPLRNKPGVVLIDGERIEFMVKDGNVLRQLRRSTLGTGPALLSIAGTSVIDQSIQQSIPSNETTLVQTTSTTSSTYIISTTGNSVIGDGITLTPGIDAIHQLNVYYGGRELRKNSLVVHDKSKAYDTTSTSINILPPEFTITINTPRTPLLVNDSVTGRPPTGSGWVFHETAETMQIQPGWIMQDANGARYTVTYSAHNTLFNGWGVGFANSITIAWPLTFIEPKIQQLTLNISDTPINNTNITIVQRKGHIWTGSESLLTSDTIQATFLKDKEASLPDVYYYGGMTSNLKIVAGNILANTQYNNTNYISIDPVLESGGPILTVGIGPRPPKHGYAIVSANKILYRPNTGWEGSDIFDYFITDRSGNKGYATIIVTTSRIRARDFDILVPYECVDYEIDPVLITGGPITSLSILTPPRLITGTLTTTTNITGDFLFLFTAAKGTGAIGKFTFKYKVTDITNNYSIGTIGVTILPPSGGFVAGPVEIRVITSSTNYAFEPVILSGGPIIKVGLGDVLPSHGTAIVTGTSILYTPTPGYVGTDTFTYSVQDSGLLISTSTVSVSVGKLKILTPFNGTVYLNSTDNLLRVKFGINPTVLNDTEILELPYDPDVTNLTVTADNMDGGVVIGSDPVVRIGGTGTIVKNDTKDKIYLSYTPYPGHTGYGPVSLVLQDAYGEISNNAGGRILTERIKAGTINATVLHGSSNNQIKPVIGYSNITGKQYGPIYGVRIDELTSHGTIGVFGLLNLIIYTPDPGWTGQDYFAYSIQDKFGNWSKPQNGSVYTLPG